MTFSEIFIKYFKKIITYDTFELNVYRFCGIFPTCFEFVRPASFFSIDLCVCVCVLQ